MKHWLTLLAITYLFITGVFSQNIEREAVSVDYILLPSEKFPDSTETYYVSVKNKNTVWGNSLGNTINADAINFNGYYRLNSTYDADIITDIEVMNDLQFLQVQLQTFDLKHRVDKNTEIPYTAYTYNVKYISPQIHYRVYTGTGTIITEGTLGGKERKSDFGSSTYEASYKNEYSLGRAWGENKKYRLAAWEADDYKDAITNISGICSNYSLNPAHVSFNVKYVKEKKTNNYDDLLQAKNIMVDAAGYFKNDQIKMINKVIQADYNTRNALLDSAIHIWEKALEESDLKNKKARIDQKVTRHIYYNLAFACILKNDFNKAQQYLQGREDEETNSVMLKNTFAGMKNLSGFIDQQKKRYELNKWRQLMLAETDVYVYKDPATRQKEKIELAKLEAAKKVESQKTAKKKVTTTKTPVKKATASTTKSTINVSAKSNAQ